MKEKTVQRDERTIAVENASYRVAYYVLSFGLLLITAYRAAVLHDDNLDLLVLAMLGGLVAAFYQAAQRILSPRWLAVALICGASAAVVAVVALGLLAR
jgi:peptidoglycan/LPS O-acetylase OafA/YrhL